ncbi:hypothetical protein AAFF_G00198530 [Aldrovandia affinis]|uniref:Uncharacterized protein n=1 Tax=Aldrovandia affinis TaxID=143900 RepID=A0AAD7RIL0_9TELE|nr:hypothetical protein AAFF_G00198530 [Aldrovandia affinis]
MRRCPQDEAPVARPRCRSVNRPATPRTPPDPQAQRGAAESPLLGPLRGHMEIREGGREGIEPLSRYITPDITVQNLSNVRLLLFRSSTEDQSSRSS